MRLKVYTISGASNARVAKPFYLETTETVVFSATPSTYDGSVIDVHVGVSATVYRLGWGYADDDAAQDALDEFMNEQGFEQIKRDA